MLTTSFRKYLAGKHQWEPFEHSQPDFLAGRQAAIGGQTTLNIHYFHLIQCLCTTHRHCKMFSIRGAALLFQSCHISRTGHEIGAHSHSKKATGPALLK